ncbi:MAG: hypothetical protein A2W19_07750 [Spirochaetes bacterium RBG_16_49_21]|nr:MAG: hypothetical protein A2W19_07750 [Spirochaetes bacterium RBG_16_49_21]
MNKKLTLLLDETVINQAKSYAERHKETLSGMVEKYFKYLTAKNPNKTKVGIPQEIEELVGIIKIPGSLDIKKEYRRHRANKALHE